MTTLGKFEIVSERVAYLAKHQMPLLYRIVRRWHVPLGTETDVVAQGMARISKMKTPEHLAHLLLKRPLAGRDLRHFDHELIRLITTPEYRNYPAVGDALTKIFKDRGKLLRHAGRFTRYELCEDAVNAGGLAFWTGLPRGELARKLCGGDTGNPEFVDSIRALVMTYIEYAARQLNRKSPLPLEPPDNLAAEPDHVTELRIAADKLVDRLLGSRKITEQQAAFWYWRRENFDALQQKFDVNMSAVETARLKKELMEVLIEAANRKCRKSGEKL